MHKIKKADESLGVYNAKKLHSYFCRRVSKLLFPGKELICFAVIYPVDDGDLNDLCGPKDSSAGIQIFLLTGEKNSSIIYHGIWGNGGKTRLQ